MKLRFHILFVRVCVCVFAHIFNKIKLIPEIPLLIHCQIPKVKRTVSTSKHSIQLLPLRLPLPRPSFL